eukprot:Pompholyxophrys_punicea_v1_NODE_41_length_4663_cov_8.672092.p3 type:complete len:103 gc:universal NODE_41_length_4663_cov_8.672092:4331-4023(-)
MTKKSKKQKKRKFSGSEDFFARKKFRQTIYQLRKMESAAIEKGWKKQQREKCARTCWKKSELSGKWFVTANLSNCDIYLLENFSAPRQQWLIWILCTNVCSS